MKRIALRWQPIQLLAAAFAGKSPSQAQSKPSVGKYYDVLINTESLTNVSLKFFDILPTVEGLC